MSQTIDDLLWQQRATFIDLFSRAHHEACGAGVFVRFSSPGNKIFVVFSRQNCDLTAWCFLKANSHIALSIVNLSSMPDRDNDNRFVLYVENHPPITNSEARTFPAFQPFHITRAACRKLIESRINSTANLRREFGPLFCACGGEYNRSHSLILSHFAIFTSTGSGDASMKTGGVLRG
jgi:hypothetical protein